MEKFLYQFNYPPEHQSLCAIESFYLFGQEIKSKMYFSNVDIDINRSAFIKAKIEIYAVSENIDDLITMIENQNHHFDSYKVIYLKNDVTHLEYEKTLDACNRLSKKISGKNVMRDQSVTIALTKLNDRYIVGLYHHGYPTWQKYQNKPYTFSNALDLKLARTVINIATGQNDNISLVDPCCGMGTVVMEGLALGYKIDGYDISREISYKARKNLEHFNLNPLVINRSSIQEVKKYYDVSIIDIPYNLYAPITYEEQCDIINQAYRISDKLILISYDEMDQEVIQAGFMIEKFCEVKKTMFTKFGRKVYVCKKNP